MESWRDTTDVILVFAGLFSAVVATFVAQTFSTLQPDYGQITASLLFEQVALLRATSDGTSIDDVPTSILTPNSTASPTLTQLWVNGLWFSSLSASLATASIAVTVKQWVQYYTLTVYGSPREQARVRQFRFRGLERWRVHYIIGILPMLLHLALFLYFAGLIMFLTPLNITMAGVTGFVAGAVFVFNLITHFVSVWDPQCLCKMPCTPISVHWFDVICRSSHRILSRILNTLYLPPLRPLPRLRTSMVTEEIERKAILGRVDEVDAQALTWLYSISSNPTAKSIVVQSISGLHHGFKRMDLLSSLTDSGLLEEISRYIRGDNLKTSLSAQNKVERLARAHLRLQPYSVEHTALRKTSDVFSSLDTVNPRLNVLRSCVILLREPSLWVPITCYPTLELERYTTAAAELHPFVWGRLMECSLIDARVPRGVGWPHAFRLLNNFFISYMKRDPFDSQDDWLAKCSMMFEYLDLLLTSRESNLMQIARPHHRAFGELPFDFVETLPKACGVLVSALDAWIADEPSPQSSEKWRRPGLITCIFGGFRTIAADSLRDSSNNEEIQESIRHAVQGLLESNRANAIDEEDLFLCYQILFCGIASKDNTPLRSIHWTSMLLESLLSNRHHIPYLCIDALVSAFEDGNLHVHRAFRKLSSGSFRFHDASTDSTIYRLSKAYIYGLLHSTQTWKAEDRTLAMYSLFQESNFLWSHYDPTSSNRFITPLKLLFKNLSPSDVPWVTKDLLSLIENPNLYRTSIQKACSKWHWRLLQWHIVLFNIHRLCDRMCQLHPHTELDKSNIYLYIHGRDIDYEWYATMEKLAYPHMAPYVLRIDDELVYAPYAVLYNPGNTPLLSSKFHELRPIDDVPDLRLVSKPGNIDIRGKDVKSKEALELSRPVFSFDNTIREIGSLGFLWKRVANFVPWKITGNPLMQAENVV